MSEQSPQFNEHTRIAALNDSFRKAGPNENWLITPGVQGLPDVPGLIGAVMTFDAFTPDNDPYDEHDFGNINWQNEKTYWKIDYYDQELVYGENPLSPECRRVLTLLLSSEW